MEKMKETRVTLGNDVTVEERSSNRLIVVSRNLELPWRVRDEGLPGTAIKWKKSLWEVWSVRKEAGLRQWELKPWPDNEIVRQSDRLDAERIEELLRTQGNEVRTRQTRRRLMPLLPLVGFLPRDAQLRLEREINLPASAATTLSGGLEVLIGVVLFAVIKGRVWFPPPALAWIILLSPVLVLEGVVRLWSGLAADEPIGSFFSIPLSLRKRDPIAPVAADTRRPMVRRLDEKTGTLELVTDDPRPDWTLGGALRFRGLTYGLVERSSDRGRSLFFFERVSETTEPTLSLRPPATAPRVRRRGRGMAVDTLRFVLVAFAPRHVQEYLAPVMKLQPRTPTFMGAGLELLGGGINLGGKGFDDPMALFNLFLILEGAFRLLWTMVSDAPVGSVLGLPFRAVYAGWLREIKENGPSV